LGVLHQTPKPIAKAAPTFRRGLLSGRNETHFAILFQDVNLPVTPSAPSTSAPQLSPLDELLSSLGNAMRTLGGNVQASRPTPRGASASAEGVSLSDTERRLSGALMRVNHVGEVCAQALYQAQALTARSAALRQQMLAAAREETDHLAWTQERLRELGARPSWLNPLWYGGAFSLGLLAGRLGDATSLGFVVETERQVEEHLAGHLNRLPASDHRSRAIVAAMQADEARHADQALSSGAHPLPPPVPQLMRAAALVMTSTAHHV
jgi:3-demethoxyubiquinol 3-hydroxylase